MSLSDGLTLGLALGGIALMGMGLISGLLLFSENPMGLMIVTTIIGAVTYIGTDLR